jgi:hypothetical protein
VDYGTVFSNPIKGGGPSIGLYKLHGSLNWLRCPICGASKGNLHSLKAKLSRLLHGFGLGTQLQIPISNSDAQRRRPSETDAVRTRKSSSSAQK